MNSVNEKSTAYLTVNFLDKNGNPAIPSSASYNVKCETTGNSIRSETTISPASSVEITLNSTDNTIQTVANKTEVRLVTVTAVYGSGDQLSREFRYELVNFSAVT